MNVQDRQRLIACEQEIASLKTTVAQLVQSLAEVSRNRGADTPPPPAIGAPRETISKAVRNVLKRPSDPGPPPEYRP